MIRKIIVVYVMIFLATSIHTTAFAEITINGVPEFEYKDELKAGDIIRVTGIGGCPINWDHRDSFAKTFARQAARMDALRNLAEFIAYRGGVKVNDIVSKEFLLSDMIVEYGHVVIKNVRQVGTAKFFEDGHCEVTMEDVLPANWKSK